MATKKRANGEGCIHKNVDKKTGNTSWKATIMLGYKDNGQPNRPQFYGKTYKEVKQKLDDYIEMFNKGTLPTDNYLLHN